MIPLISGPLIELSIVMKVSSSWAPVTIIVSDLLSCAMALLGATIIIDESKIVVFLLIEKLFIIHSLK
jgi:hypothetical protein